MQSKKASSHTARQNQLKPVEELATVLRSLQRLLLDYGPPWYTSKADDGLRKALADADLVLRAVAR